MDFELIGDPCDIETIAVNLSIRENADLKARYGGRRWRKLKAMATVRLSNGNIRNAEIHWLRGPRRRQKEAQDQAAPGLIIMRDQTSLPTFAICADNDGCDDLSVGMLYRVLQDEAASGEALMRVIDDSGEDYLYPAGRFVIVEVPQAEVPRLLAVASADVA